MKPSVKRERERERVRKRGERDKEGDRWVKLRFGSDNGRGLVCHYTRSCKFYIYLRDASQKPAEAYLVMENLSMSRARID
jgi:hypothetical protein